MQAVTTRRESLVINGKKVPVSLHPISVIHKIQKKLKSKPRYTYFRDNDDNNKWHCTLNFRDKEYTTTMAKSFQSQAKELVAEIALERMLTDFTDKELAELAKPISRPEIYNINNMHLLLTKSLLWWYRESTQQVKPYSRYLERYCKLQELDSPKV